MSGRQAYSQSPHQIKSTIGARSESRRSSRWYWWWSIYLEDLCSASSRELFRGSPSPSWWRWWKKVGNNVHGVYDDVIDSGSNSNYNNEKRILSLIMQKNGHDEDSEYKQDHHAYFPNAKVWAPGQRHDLTTATANWGTSWVDSWVDHGGIPLMGASSLRGFNSGGPTSGWGSFGSSSSASLSGSSSSSSSDCFGFHQLHRP